MKEALENFGAGLSTVDLVLYAGLLVVLYVLFQEQINKIVNNLKNNFNSWQDNKNKTDLIPVDVEYPDSIQDDVFFELIKSWKQTRDLAEIYGADKAVEIADQMFPYLVPKEEDKNE
jgi:hypothetical protein